MNAFASSFILHPSPFILRTRSPVTSKRRKSPEAAPVPTVPPPVGPGVEVFRRVLLGALAALLVARPLVFGEDPGQLFAPTDTGNLILTFLWLLLAAAYAGWCTAARRPFGRVDLVELGLLAAIVCVFVSAETA